MTPERFRELWEPSNNTFEVLLRREALTAFVHAEAMREKCIAWDETDCSNWTDADWIEASWEKWLGRMP